MPRHTRVFAAAFCLSLALLSSSKVLQGTHAGRSDDRRFVSDTCVTVPAGLVDFWPGDGTANDLQGANNGSLAGGAGYATGLVGQGFRFTGAAGERVTIPENPSLDLETQATATAEGWFKSNTVGDFAVVAKHSCGTNNGWFFGTQAGGYISGVFIGGQGFAQDLNDGQFHHWAIVKNGTDYREYVDGVLTGNSSGPAVGTANTVDLQFGGITGGTCNNASQLNGVLDEVSYYNTALTATDIQSIYAAGPGGKCVAPALMVNDVVVSEGNSGVTNATFTVNAVRSNGTITANYATSDRSAQAPGDYTGTSGALSFIGGGAATVNVPVNGDTTPEPDESFLLTLTDPVNAVITKAVGAGTIISDDCATPPPELIDWYPGEGNANDIQGTNNGTAQGSLTYSAGKVGQAFRFNGSNTGVDLGTWFDRQTYTIDLWVNPSSAQVPFADIIDNNHTNTRSWVVQSTNSGLQFEYATSASPSIIPFTLTAGVWQHLAITRDANKVNRVYLDGVLVGSVTDTGPINYDGTQFLRLGQWGGGGRNFNGQEDEVQAFNRALSPTEIQSIYNGGSAGQCVTPSLSIGDASVVEGDNGVTNANFTVSVIRTNGNPITVQYDTADGTATAPTDYAPVAGGTLSIPGNATTGTITIPVNGDAILEPDEVFKVDLSNPSNAVVNHPQGTGTIVNDECTAAPPGMVSWWPGQGNANDIQGTNHGSLQNGAAASAVGKVNQAFGLSAANSQYVNIPDSPSLRTTNFTIDAWVNFASAGAFNHIFGKTVGASGADSYIVWYAGGALHGETCTIGNSCTLLNFSWTPAIGAWYHVAYTFDGSAHVLYLNGQPVAAGSNTTVIGYDAHPALIGADFSDNTTIFGFFDGSIDEVQFYQRALAQPEVQSIYDGSAGGNCHTSTVQFSSATYSAAEANVDHVINILVNRG